MRSTSLTTTILNETNDINECPLDMIKENEQHTPPIPIDQFVFTTSKCTPKSSFWTVTDRQNEWYKLTIPINHATTNSNVSSASSSLHVSCRQLSNRCERKQSNSNVNEQFDDITYVVESIRC
jgi:hypothetical protein